MTRMSMLHINSPPSEHAPQSIAALKAGKHVACTVPMGVSIDECRQVVELQRATGKTYMMMETVVYSREYLFVKELYDKGELGRIQFLRGSHQQDMEGWPGYWPGFPPMWYATHCVSPCLAILSTPGKPAMAESVVCHGSGRVRDELIAMLLGFRSSITCLSTLHCSSPHNSAVRSLAFCPGGGAATAFMLPTALYRFPCDVPPSHMRSTRCWPAVVEHINCSAPR